MFRKKGKLQAIPMPEPRIAGLASTKATASQGTAAKPPDKKILTPATATKPTTAIAAVFLGFFSAKF